MHSVKRRLAAFVVGAAAALSLSGCAIVDAYSDSILADSAVWSYGEVARANINDQNAGIGTRNWNAEPGRAMAGGILPHSFAAPRALATGSNAIVISFGTNDAANAAQGRAGSYSSGSAKLYALEWMNRAKLAGASCVVWVTGNPAAYPGRPWQGAYRNWLNDFNGWLGSLGTTAYPQAGPIQLRIVAWGFIAGAAGMSKDENVHPTAAGATLLGQAIKSNIQSCTG
jgi:hypothetical protein